MNSKYVSTLIIFFVISHIGWTFYEQYDASNKLSKLSNTSHDDVNSIMVRNPILRKWIVLQNLPESIEKSLFTALANSKSAMGYRPITPNENVVIRINTEKGVFDFDFRFHKQEGKWIKFDLVCRDYLGSNSFTQKHHGSFKSKELVEFLQFVENES